MHQILIHGDGIVVRRNNLIGSIEYWGPDFEIDVEVKVNSFSKSERILEIFRFASVEGNCCEIGQRLPALFTWSQDNTFHLATNIGTEVELQTKVREGFTITEKVHTSTFSLKILSL